MYFAIAHSAGKARAQVVQNRRQALHERRLAATVERLLDAVFAEVAAHARHGVVDIDHIVDARRGDLLKAISEGYTRVGAAFFAAVEKAYAEHAATGRKTAVLSSDKPAKRALIENKNGGLSKGPVGSRAGDFQAVETKGMASEFWRAFHNWAHSDAFAEVKKINAATKTILRRVVRREKDAGASYTVIAKAIADKAKQINKKRAMKIARTEVHRGSTYAVDEAVRSTRRQFEREWVSMRDDRTRPEPGTNPPHNRWDHRAANGQRRAMGVPFDVSGEKLMHPGDPNGSAANVIN